MNAALWAPRNDNKLKKKQKKAKKNKPKESESKVENVEDVKVEDEQKKDVAKDTLVDEDDIIKNVEIILEA